MKLILPGELAEQANAEGLSSVRKFERSEKERKSLAKASAANEEFHESGEESDNEQAWMADVVSDADSGAEMDLEEGEDDDE